MMNGDSPPRLMLVPVSVGRSTSMPYTRLEYLTRDESPVELLERDMMATTIAEEIDMI